MITIGTKSIAPDQPPYIIAELGVNHDGEGEQALRLVDLAAEAKADAIKLQLFHAEQLMSAASRLAVYQAAQGARDPLNLLRSLELPLEWAGRALDRATERGLDSIVTVFSLEMVSAAAALPWAAFKVASPDVINRPLIDALRRCERPLLVSTGAATMDEVRTCAEWIGDHPHVILHCVSSYPAADEDAALAGRGAMAREMPQALGYSDHTAAVDTGALAVASGAVLLEKHLTHDRGATGPDHAASLDGVQFKEYVRLAHRAHRMLGPPEKRVLSVEADVRAVSRQSIVCTRALPGGHQLRRDDLTIKRPGDGLPPAQLERIVGRTLSRDVAGDMPLREDDLT